jgi:hypothetical protein
MAYLLPEDAGEQPQTTLAARCSADDDADAKVVFTARRALLRAAEAAVKADIAMPRADAIRSSVKPSTCPVREHRAGTREAAYSLRHEVRTMLDFILEHQSKDGWLGGPDNNSPDDPDQYWVGWDVVYALMQYAEAEPAQAPRIEKALLRYVAETERRMRSAPLAGWSSVRWPELSAILQRMADTFDLAPDAPERAMLLATSSLVAQQGFDWRAYFTDAAASPNFNTSIPFAPGWTLTEHGVNHAMALKDSAVTWRAGEGPAAAAFSRQRFNMLDAAHGMPSGAFSADECLGGREPNRGVELCTIVETAYSLAFLHRTHGDVEFADRAERVLLNQLPAAISEDMWGHNCKRSRFGYRGPSARADATFLASLQTFRSPMRSSPATPSRTRGAPTALTPRPTAWRRPMRACPAYRSLPALARADVSAAAGAALRTSFRAGRSGSAASWATASAPTGRAALWWSRFSAPPKRTFRCPSEAARTS